MLTLYIEKLAFCQRTILTDSLLNLSKGVLTILSGDSGSGKSSLIDALTLRNNFATTYEVDGISINEMSYVDAKHYIYKHVGIVYQKPKMLEDLTVRDQMKMIQELRGLKTNADEWVSILELEGLLDKYPAKLSGGEQVRAAILLVLMKEPDILILDEPSAALDAYHSTNVIKALKRYCEIGHTVLISTHDQEIIQQGEQIYRIENKKLQLIHNGSGHVNLPLLNTQLAIEKNMDFLHEYFRKMKRHRKFYQKMLRYLTIFTVAFVCFGSAFNNLNFSNTNSVYYTQLSKTLVAFKGNNRNQQMYPFDAFIKHMESRERNALYKLSTPLMPLLIRERFDISLYKNKYAYSIADEEYWNSDAFPSQSVLRVHKDGKELSRLTKENDKTITMSTYYSPYSPVNDEDYQEEIKKNVRLQLNYSGIYLSGAIANKFKLSDTDWKDTLLDVDVLIPVYNSTGKIDTEGNEISYPTCVPVTIKDVPVAGILNYGDFIVRNKTQASNNGEENSIYIDFEILRPYINEFRTYKSRTIYHTKDGQTFIDELPEDVKDKVDMIQEDTPWIPDVYEVKVPQYNNISSITKQITDIGLNVNANGSSYPATTRMTKDLKTALSFASIALAIIVFFAYIAMKFNDKEHERNVNQYFSDLGLTNKEIKKIKIRMFIRDGGLIVFYAILVEGILIYGSDLLRFGMSGFSMVLVIATIMMAMIVEVLIPYLLERGNQIDKVK